MRRALAAFVLVGSLVACGGEAGQLHSDLLAATAIVSGTTQGIIRAGNEVPGDVLDPGTAEPRLEVFRVADGSVVWLHGASPPDGDLIFTRDPLAVGSSAALLAEASTLVVVIRPLVVPTSNGIPFDSWLVAFGPDGRLIGSDWDGAEHAKLEKLLEMGNDPVRVLVDAIDALTARELDRPIDPSHLPLLEVLDS